MRWKVFAFVSVRPLAVLTRLRGSVLTPNIAPKPVGRGHGVNANGFRIRIRIVVTKMARLVSSGSSHEICGPNILDTIGQPPNLMKMPMMLQKQSGTVLEPPEAGIATYGVPATSTALTIRERNRLWMTFTWRQLVWLGWRPL